VERAARWIARHPKRTGAAAFALLAVVLVTWIVSAQMRAIREENARRLLAATEENDRQLRAAAEENDRRRAKSLVEAVLTAPPDAVPYAVETIDTCPM
jgi:nitrate reductase cytochrome c-type subunit